MKSIYKIFLSTLLISAIGVSSCTNDFEEINTNPNQFADATPELLLSGAMKSALDLVGGDMNFWMYLQYGRYAGGMSGNGLQTFGEFPTFSDNYYQNLYLNVIKQSRTVQDLFADDIAFNNRVQISKILEAYGFSIVISTWGPAQVSQSVGDALFGIPLDSEEAAYGIILNTLADASDNFDTSAEGDMLSQDPMYDGDNVNWLRFANTLRLKIALRLTGAQSNELVALGEAHIEDVLQNDAQLLILDNDQNAALSWGTAGGTSDWSYMYFQTEQQQNPTFTPRVNDELILWCKAFNDPRLDVFAKRAESYLPVTDEVDDAGTPVSVTYGSPYTGSPVGGSNPYTGWGLNNNLNPLAGIALEQLSEFGDEYTKADAEFMIISAAETEFMLAEIANRGLAATPSLAATHYAQGIQKSFERYFPGGGVDVNAYLNTPGVTYNTASTATLNNWTSTASIGILVDSGLKQIATQRWLTMYFQGHDAWCLQRRTDLLGWAPFMNPWQRNAPLDHPERMRYSEQDKARSPEEYDAAINSFLGGVDNIYVQLDQNKNRTLVNWVEYPAAFSSDFGKWYGTTIAELDANGLTDVSGLSTEEQAAAIANGTGYVRN